MSTFVSTSGVLLETSCGAFTVDMCGADAPAHTADFVNLCRCKAWNGAVVTATIPDVAVIFSHDSSSSFKEALWARLTARSSPENQEESSAGGLFWSLAGCGAPREKERASPTRSAAMTGCGDAVEQEVRAQKQKLCVSTYLEEAQRCQRQRVSALSRSGATTTTRAAGAGVLGRKGLVLVPIQSGPATGCTGASDPTALTQFFQNFRFAITLSDRNMDFLEKAWLCVGEITEGLSTVLPRLRAAVAATAPRTRAETQQADGIMTMSSPWPRPIRLVRVKHTTLLPTAGTDRYVNSAASSFSSSSSSSSRLLSAGTSARTTSSTAVLAALQTSGCFRHWASHGAVLRANSTLVQALRQSLASTDTHHEATTGGATHASLLRLPATSTSSPSSATATMPRTVTRNGDPEGHSDEASVVSIEYEPHFTAEYLSSDEELAAELEDQQQSHQHDQSSAWEPAARLGRGSQPTSSKAQQARRDAARQLHQEKANETLSLMLNVLNGITDFSGEVRPPENVLFVCKLNPATTGDGLAMVFAQFGKVVSADVILDAKTKQSLCYGFVEFESVEACYRAFTRMDKALVDDCRIHVDFSQSVSKLWAQRQRQQRQEQQQHLVSRKRDREE